ncbi:actin-histidine N-methyltransferase isoform X2 [Nematostella vectensis]|uniref:actin-histidine N-methyltransferase isoform X2 n=1 Tax=Nematostella vectensis TaxID=45351 RepID=UPI0020770A72|nr:actin-histidine N-methyltransferase isoform X2 [Nematostella vectensis]
MGKKGKRKNSSPKKITALNREVLGICNHIQDVIKDFPLHPAAQWQEYEKIYSLIELIRGKQKELAIPWKDQKRDAHIEEFTQWFKANGGTAEHVEIHDFGDQGLGLRATADLQENQVFVAVPEKLLMSVVTAKKSSLGPLISREHGLRSMPHVVLALHVLCERLHEDSTWAPYLNILPRSYSTCLYFSPDDMMALQGSPSMGEALKQFRGIVKQYVNFFRLVQINPEASRLPLKNSFTFDDFRWAVSTVMTRQNDVKVSSNETVKALIPMWDMCNHCNGPFTTGFDDSTKEVKSLAFKPTRAGDQVFIFYGRRNNADRLFHNGFVYTEAEEDWVNIQLGVSKNDRLYAMKAQILAMVGLDASGRSYRVLRGPEPISPELRIFLRVFSMNTGELKPYLFNPEGLPVTPLAELCKAEFTLSEENELKLWSFFHTRLQLILGQYKTTKQEDEALLSRDDNTLHTRNCIRLRMSERDILVSALEHAKARLQELSPQEATEVVSGSDIDTQRDTCVEQEHDLRPHDLVCGAKDDLKDLTIEDSNTNDLPKVDTCGLSALSQPATETAVPGVEVAH